MHRRSPLSTAEIRRSSDWRSGFCIKAGHLCQPHEPALLSPLNAKIKVNTNYRKTQQRRAEMSDQENRKPQQSDPQKPGWEQKPGNEPNQPMQPKQEVPSGQPKTPQPEQEKHDQEKKKSA